MILRSGRASPGFRTSRSTFTTSRASRAFYKDFLGFAEPYSLPNADGTLHLTWIKINDDQTIELFPEKEAGTDRLYHIAL